MTRPISSAAAKRHRKRAKTRDNGAGDKKIEPTFTSAPVCFVCLKPDILDKVYHCKGMYKQYFRGIDAKHLAKRKAFGSPLAPPNIRFANECPCRFYAFCKFHFCYTFLNVFIYGLNSYYSLFCFCLYHMI